MTRAATVSTARPAVSAEGLTKRFGYRTAVRGVDLEVPPGGCFAIFGSNGAGKSTLLRLISTRMRPSSGRLSVLGLDPERDGARLRALVGAVFHETFLRGDLTLEENLRYHGGLHGLPRREIGTRSDRLISRLGLFDRRQDPVRTFSQGMARRAALARSLLHDPRLWLLDEPFSGLDRDGCRLLEEIIGEERAAGRAVILVTHDLAAGLRLADDAVALAGGAIAARGRAAVEEMVGAGPEGEA